MSGRPDSRPNYGHLEKAPSLSAQLLIDCGRQGPSVPLPQLVLSRSQPPRRPARPVISQRRRSLPAEPKPRETPSLAQTLLLCFSRKKKLVPPSRRVAGPTNLGLRRLEACVHRGNGVAFSHSGHTGKKEPPRLSMCRGPWALLIVQSGKLF